MIYIDCDGVLSDFHGSMCTYLGIGHFKPTYWDCIGKDPRMPKEACIEHATKELFVASMGVLPGAKTLMNYVKEAKLDYHILTSPWPGSKFWHAERVRWLKEHFDIPESKITFTSDKSLFKGDVLIEDKFHNAAKFVIANPGAYSFLVGDMDQNLDYLAPSGLLRTSHARLPDIIKTFC